MAEAAEAAAEAPIQPSQPSQQQAPPPPPAQQQQLKGQARNEQERAAAFRELKKHRTEWLQDLGGNELTKEERAQATKLAHSIVAHDQQCSTKEALKLAVESITEQRDFEQEFGAINPSSDPHQEVIPKPPQPPPRNEETSSSSEDEQSHQSKRRRGKQRAKDKRRKSASNRSTEKKKRNSEASFGSDLSMDENQENTKAYKKLRIPEEISKKVRKQEYVDLWWFTPAAGKMGHEREQLKINMGSSVSFTTTNKNAKPSQFVEDVDLPIEDFDFAITEWVRCMQMHHVNSKIVRSWTKFNNTIKELDDRHLSVIRQASQQLHSHQRRVWADKVAKRREAKTKLESKKSKLSRSDRKLYKRRMKLFNPAKFPTSVFNEIKSRLADERGERQLRAIEAAEAKAGSSSSSPPQRQNQAKQGKGSFRTNQSLPSSSKASGFGTSSGPRKACALCGSREPGHNARSCSVERLAYSPSQETYVTRGGTTGKLLLTRQSNTSVCLGHNTGACTWAKCSAAHRCSLCSKDSCNAQDCRLSRPPSRA
ncbi:hypothetical protein V8E36_001885 [Tilletia maclaganii]